METSMSKARKLFHVDLFAGCGGLSLGLEQAGFCPVFVNELNADARASYLINRTKEAPHLADPQFHCADVKDLVLNERVVPALGRALKRQFEIDVASGDLDLVAGGPPCQGFSGIGHRRSYSVDKEQLPSNHLYQDMAFIIARLQPKIFLFENVRGLLSAKWTANGQRGEIWRDICDTFAMLRGYSTDYALVRAYDYGVPQNRPRVLLVGIRDDVKRRAAKILTSKLAGGFLPPPTGEAPDLEDLLADLIDPLYEPGATTIAYPCPATTDVQRSLRTAKRDGASRVLAKGEALTEHTYSKHSHRIQRKFRAMQEGDGNIPASFRTKKFAQRLLPERWGSEGPTITATSLPDDYVHFAQPRTLTVREWARLQLFPDWYQFAGKRTTGGLRRAGNPREGFLDREVPKYTQIGNAVPVGLARALGRHFKKILTA
jgi:DNA (cytosine-5)-methyltransferase 1